MNELEQVENNEIVITTIVIDESSEIQPCDERYPGSFFTIPAPIVLGKTAWSLT